MPDLQHPETGEHVRASSATAEKLIEQGWKPQASDSDEESPAKAPKAKKATAAPAAKKEDADKDGDDGSAPPPAEIPEPDKPLGEMKLGELIEYAEKIGFDADSIAALKKPGTSKAKAITAIEAHVAAKQS